MSTPTQRILFLPDIHVPDHDESALKIVRAFKRDWKPHYVVQIGDLMTCDQVSTFMNDSDLDLKEEFEMGRDLLADLGVTHFLMGNHEERLTRVGLLKKTLRSMVEPARNLGLDKAGILWKPYDKADGVFKFGKLHVLHGCFTNEYAAKKHADAYGCCLFGHTHRVQVHQPKHAFSAHTGFNIGCLSKLDLNYGKTGTPSGWGQAFAFGYFFRSGHFNLYIVRLIGNQIAIEGKVYKR